MSPQFSESDLKLCQTIAHQAANAIENARLYEEVQSRAERMWLANMVSHDIGTQLDIHQLLWEVVRLIRETFDCYYVAVALIEKDELVFRSGINYLYQTTPKASLSLRGDEQSIAGWVAQHGRPVVVPDVRDDPRFKVRPGLEDIRSQLAVPLKVLERTQDDFEALDQTIGVLDVGSTETGTFTVEDQQLLEALAAQVSVAIENARLFGRIQEERATLEAIINGTGDAIITTDTIDRVLFVNPAARRAFLNGGSVKPGTPLSEAVDNKALHELWQGAAQSRAHSAEIPLPDGRTFHASIAGVPEVGKVAVMQDISYLKELDEMKSEFVSTVSHDLRSPLQVIQTSAELLPKVGKVNLEQQREIDHILAIVRRISDLVQNLLDLGRIEAGVGIEVEPCAIDEIIARAAGAYRSLAEGKGLDFEINLPRALPLIKGDPVRLDQVITNVVNNAIKFTPEGSVTVAARSEDDWVIIEVRDSGIGIPPEAQERLFQKFYRVKSPETRGIQGTGLGLAIVKSIVESHGGKIQVESFPRLGSVFTVMLPVHPEALAATD
jgi:signal transduction histidine kinase